MVDPDLFRRVSDGEYEVDPYAVAEAMLRRSARLSELRRRSRVLVTANVQRLPAREKK